MRARVHACALARVTRARVYCCVFAVLARARVCCRVWRAGKREHSGVAITRGVRFLLVGYVAARLHRCQMHTQWLAPAVGTLQAPAAEVHTHATRCHVACGLTGGEPPRPRGRLHTGLWRLTTGLRSEACPPRTGARGPVRPNTTAELPLPTLFSDVLGKFKNSKIQERHTRLPKARQRQLLHDHRAVFLFCVHSARHERDEAGHRNSKRLNNSRRGEDGYRSRPVRGVESRAIQTHTDLLWKKRYSTQVAAYSQ